MINTLDQQLYNAAKGQKIRKIHSLLQKNSYREFTCLTKTNHTLLLALTKNKHNDRTVKNHTINLSDVISIGGDTLNHYLCNVGRNVKILSFTKALIREVPSQYLPHAMSDRDLLAVQQYLQNTQCTNFQQLTQENRALLFEAIQKPQLRSVLQSQWDQLFNVISIGGDTLNHYLCDLGINTQVPNFIEALIQRVPTQYLSCAVRAGNKPTTKYCLQNTQDNHFQQLTRINRKLLLLAASLSHPNIQEMLQNDQINFVKAISTGGDVLNDYLCDLGINTQVPNFIEALIQRVPTQYLSCAVRAGNKPEVEYCLQNAQHNHFQQLTYRNRNLLLLAVSPAYPNIQEMLQNDQINFVKAISIGRASLDYYLLGLTTKAEGFKKAFIQTTLELYQPLNSKPAQNLTYSAAKQHDLFMLYLLLETDYILETQEEKITNIEWRDSDGYNALAIALFSCGGADFAANNPDKSIPTAKFLKNSIIRYNCEVLPAINRQPAGYSWRFYREISAVNGHAESLIYPSLIRPILKQSPDKPNLFDMDNEEPSYFEDAYFSDRDMDSEEPSCSEDAYPYDLDDPYAPMRFSP